MEKPNSGTKKTDTLIFEFGPLGPFLLARRWVIFLSLMFFLVASVFAFGAKLGFDRAEQSKSWPSVSATVWKVEKHEHHDEDFGTHYTYTSEVWYKVEGVRYEKTFAERLTSPHQIYYNPKDHGDCILEPGVESDKTDLALFAAIFSGLFAVVVLLIAFSPQD